MRILLYFLGGISLGYIAMSWAESFLHHHVQHATRSTQLFWRRFPRLFRVFLDANFSHAKVHHALTYATRFTQQFDSSEQRDRVDAMLHGARGALIKQERYGVSLSSWGILMFFLPTLPVPIAIYLLLGGVGLLGCTPWLALYALMSKYMHPYIHASREEVQRTAPRLIAWMFRTRYMQKVVCNHFMHHKYVKCCFNLMLGGDLLRGVYRRPSRADRAEMEELGLLPPESCTAAPERDH